MPFAGFVSAGGGESRLLELASQWKQSGRPPGSHVTVL